MSCKREKRLKYPTLHAAHPGSTTIAIGILKLSSLTSGGVEIREPIERGVLGIPACFGRACNLLVMREEVRLHAGSLSVPEGATGHLRMTCSDCTDSSLNMQVQQTSDLTSSVT
jgi:hypothetical protein